MQINIRTTTIERGKKQLELPNQFSLTEINSTSTQWHKKLSSLFGTYFFNGVHLNQDVQHMARDLKHQKVSINR